MRIDLSQCKWSFKWGIFRGKKWGNRSQVQRFQGSRLHAHPWTAFWMCIYEKRVSFVRPNPKFGAKLAIVWENEQFF